MEEKGGTMRYRILLYSDEPVEALGLKSVLGQADGFEVLPVCDNFGLLRGRLRDDDPDILILSVPPYMAVGRINEVKQWASEKLRTVLWVHEIHLELAFQVRKAGVNGILVKTKSIEDQIALLRKVAVGEPGFDAELEKQLAAYKPLSFTRREIRIMELLAEGTKNKEIAYQLNTDEMSIKTAMSHLMKKVGVKGRIELISFWLAYQGGARPKNNSTKKKDVH